MLRARGEAGNPVHACARRRALASGRVDGDLLRAGRRDADGGRLSLVRDGELLPAPERADGRDLRARHNLGYWLGRDYLGIGLGAVSTIEGAPAAKHAQARAPTCHALAAGTTTGQGGGGARPTTCRRANGSCSACAWTIRSRSERVAAAVDEQALGRLVGSGWCGATQWRGAGARADAARPFARRRRHSRALAS